MGITRPTGEQLRFRSAATGDHILDTYMENSEKGSRTLPDLMDDLFDGSGVFRAANFEFRFDATADKIQFRAGNFANSNTGWTDITTFFNITGTFSASTTYNNFDLLTLANKDVYIVHGLSSGTTFADEAAVIASANTDKLVDVSEARDWASKTDGQVVSTDYSSKAYAVGGTGIDTTTGSAKDWAIKTSSTVGNTGEYSAKYWATSTSVTTVSSGIANINTVAAAIASVNTTAANISNVNTVAGISADVTTVANIDGNVSTVAGISANTTTVAGIASNVTTVAGVATNVTTVAGIASNVTTVANNNTNVTTVATNVTDLQTVADEIDNNNLQTVANDIAAVITAADDLNEATSEIDTVANSIANVDLVGGSIANVNTVATNIANVNTTATNIANVNTVAGISANVTTVAGISADVTTAATNNANITTVAGISSNVTTVAGISANVTTVAGISADVTTAATNVAAFNNTYLGAQSSAPTLDPDGSALDVGDLYFDTTSNTMKVYAQSGWTAAGSSVNGTADRFNFTATAGQTTFTGADANGNTLAYDSGYADIYMNGVKLAPADYTATNGTSIVLASGAALNDTIEIIAYGTFILANHLTQTQSDARYVQVAGDTMTGNLNVGGTVTADAATLSGTAPVLNYTDTDNSITAQIGSGTSDFNIATTTSHNIDIRTNNTRRMVVESDGDISFYNSAGSSQKFFWDASAEKLGIGTSPSYNLDVSASNAVSMIRTPDTTSPTLGLFVNSGSNGVGTISVDNGGHMTFDTGSSGAGQAERMRIDSNGALLLGAPSRSVYYNSVNVYNASAVIKTNVSNEVADLVITNGNNDFGSSVDFARTNSAGNDVRFATISAQPTNNTAGSEAGVMRFYTKGTGDSNVVERMRISSAGDVELIQSNNLYWKHAGGGTIRAGITADSSDNLVFSTGSSDSTAMTIDGSGNLLVAQSSTTIPGIGNTTVGHSLHSQGYAVHSRDNAQSLYINRNGTDGTLAQFNKGGAAVGTISVTSSGVTYNTTSDRRLKDNIEPIADGTEKLMAMKPVTHTWIADPNTGETVHGFIAQEMQEIVPEAVSGEPDGEEMMSMDYGRITPVLVAALQEATNEIKALKQRVSELEAK